MENLNNYISNYMGVEFEEDPYYFVDDNNEGRD